MSSEAPDLGYADAVRELDAILAEIERPDVDLDRLTGRVERASELVRLLKSKIAATELQVTRVVDAMRDEGPPADEPVPEPDGDGTIPF